MLAAAITACSNESPAYSAAVVSSTTVQRLMPSSAVSRTISDVARADAFQLIRRRSSPRMYSRSEWNSLPVCPHDFIRRCWPSRPEEPTDGNGSGDVCGTTSTSSVPASVVVRCVRPSTSRRSAAQRPGADQAAARGRHPVRGAGGLARRRAWRGASARRRCCRPAPTAADTARPGGRCWRPGCRRAPARRPTPSPG